MKELIPYLKHIKGCEADWNVGRRANNETLIPCECGLGNLLMSLGLHEEYVAHWQRLYDSIADRK